ncbi:MAG: B12-binding domain-containing radical SAM protein [Desulfatibacillaceae bacterium]
MDLAFVHKGYEDIGIEQLSAVLKQRGHRVRLFYDGSPFSSNVGLNSELLARFLDEDEAAMKRRILDGLAADPPDAVAFSCVTATWPWSADMARRIKSRLGLPVIFGGAHPSAVPERVMENPAVDVVVRGEGEWALAELLESLSNGAFPDHAIPNTVFRQGAGLRMNPCRPYIADLDSLPYPDKDLFNDKVEVFYKYYMLMSGRGCPYACTYCGQSVNHTLYAHEKRHTRRRSVDHVVGELARAVAGHEVRYVSFRDDIFTMDAGWLAEFAEKYPQRVGVPFFCYSHPAVLNERAVELLARAGCRQVKVGIQSFSKAMLTDVMGRPVFGNEIFRLRDAFSCHGIGFLVDHMLGMPGQTEQDLVEAVRKYIEMKPDSISGFYLVYFPKTRIIDLARNCGLLDAADVDAIERGEGYAEAGYPSPEARKSDTRMLKYQYYLDVIPILPRAVSRMLLKTRALHALPYSTTLRQALLLLHDVVKGDIRLRYFSWYIFAKKNLP